MCSAQTNTYESKRKKQLQKLYNTPNALAFIRNKRLEWFGDTGKADWQIIKITLVGKMNKTRAL
jgi:hypothetical protein